MHVLDVVLQHISSDEAAVLNLPYILNALLPLSSSAFATSSPAQKLWIARINSLQERPKHPGARWAGFCLAQRTAHLSRDILLTSADTWISFALPVLSRDDPLPTLHAAIHLITTIYTTILDMPEFHRRVVAPTVTKFSVALLNLAERPTSPVKLKALCMHTLTLLIHHHPSLHAGLQAKLHSLTIAHLSGSFPSTSSASLIQSAADLHSVLHLTGGKVRGAAVWRKSLDSAIASALSALNEITSTLGQSRSSNAVVSSSFDFPPIASENSQLALTIAVDRLRSLIALLISLLRTTTARAVAVPVGSLANLALRLISAEVDPLQNQSNGFVDPSRRMLEISLIPALWEAGCDLLAVLSQSVGHHITPYTSQYASVIAHHLDHTTDSLLRCAFLRALQSLLASAHAYPITNSFLSTRLLKSLVPCLTRFLSHESVVATATQGEEDTRSSKAKKKAKMYEGDELLRTERDVLVRSVSEGEEILATLKLMPLLISSPHTEPATSSVASRLLLSLLLHLPHIPTSLISSPSSDPTLRTRLIEAVSHACEVSILHDAANPWLVRGLPILAESIGRKGSAIGDGGELRALSLLIHPHVPPTVRGLGGAGIQGFPLYVVEGKDEREARERMGLVSLDEKSISIQQQGANVMVLDHSGLAETKAVSTPPPPIPMASGRPDGDDVRMEEVRQETHADLHPAAHTSSTTLPSSQSFSGTTTAGFTAVAPIRDTTSTLTPVPRQPALHTPSIPTSSEPTASARNSSAQVATRQDDFVPLGGGDSDSDDADIPEIDMRSDSDEE